MSILLFIEKEHNQRVLYRMEFEDQGHTVFTAPNGLQAKKIVNKKSPDLIILDPGIPGMSAERMLRYISAIAPHTPIIIFSAYDGFQRQVFSQLVDAYLMKSSDLSCLIEIIEKILWNRRQQQPGILPDRHIGILKDNNTCTHMFSGFSLCTAQRGPPSLGP